MIKFYTDSHIAKTIVVQLRYRNIDVVHCQDVGMDDADDVEHLEYATSQGRTVITSDADFLSLDAQWQSSGALHAGIISVHPERKDVIGTLVAIEWAIIWAMRDGVTATPIPKRIRRGRYAQSAMVTYTPE